MYIWREEETGSIRNPKEIRVPTPPLDESDNQIIRNLGRTPRVLIVDDQVQNVKLLEAFLRTMSLPAELEEAFDGIEALQKVDQFKPDLILLDIMMPGLDGFEVCRRIKSDTRTRYITIIIITALDHIDERVKGIEAGADDFLTKPVNKVELIARTKMLLKTKGLNDKVLRYKDTLQQLIELTSFSKRYAARDVLLNSFAHSAARLTGLEQVAIIFRAGDDDFRIVGGHGVYEEGGGNKFQTMGVGATGWILRNGEPLVVRSDDDDQQAFFSLDSGFVGVPLKSFDGIVFGTINAYGERVETDEEVLGVLSLMAQRISSEIQLKDHSRKLEGMVATRTTELRSTLQELESANVEITHAQEETIFRLSLAAEFKDEATAAHLNRMSNYSHAIATAMGMKESYCTLIRLAAPMHDVGKIGIPDSLLLKPGKLTAEEYDEMKKHTIIGGRILSGSSSRLLQMSERIALSHHEKYGGGGYPYGLVSEDIHLEGRIVALADVFDALITRRPYKDPMPMEKALSIIKEDTGPHFDPRVSSAFFQALEEILKVKERFQEEDMASFE